MTAQTSTTSPRANSLRASSRLSGGSDDPALASHFVNVSRALENSGSRAESNIGTEASMTQKMSLQDEVNTHVKLARERDELLEKIRAMPDFLDFL